MDIKTIKFLGTGIFIHRTEKVDPDEDPEVFKVTKHKAPAESFTKAIEAFIPVFLKLAEIRAQRKTRIKKITFSRTSKQEILSFVATAEMDLLKSGKYIEIKLPAFLTATPEGAKDSFNICSPEDAKVVKKLRKEAIEYAKGKYLQTHSGV